MRTTVTLDDDVAAAVEQLRRDEGIGVSRAINTLIRAGLARPAAPARYRHRSMDIGLKIDVRNVGEVLDLLDQR